MPSSSSNRQESPWNGWLWTSCYVLVAMDYFTNWPEAQAIPDREVETVEGMFSRFGWAGTLRSDQGQNFESKVFAEICECMGIHKTRRTPPPASKRRLGGEFYCSVVQDSTSGTPALLMLGRELRTPALLAFGQPPDGSSSTNRPGLHKEAAGSTGLGTLLRPRKSGKSWVTPKEEL